MSESIVLENGIVKIAKAGKFTLTLNSKDILVENCDIITYLSGKFIAVKIGNTVQAFKAITRYNPIRDIFFLEPIAEMVCPSDNTKVYLKIRINEVNYIVDRNAQISLCGCNKSIY